MKSCEQIVNAMPLARLRVLLNVAIYGLRDESVETAVYHVETTVYGPLSSLMCSIQALVANGVEVPKVVIQQHPIRNVILRILSSKNNRWR